MHAENLFQRTRWGRRAMWRRAEWPTRSGRMKLCVYVDHGPRDHDHQFNYISQYDRSMRMRNVLSLIVIYLIYMYMQLKVLIA
jgi:hypothetical protein